MGTKGAAGFDAFVDARAPRLLRTAHLLCGDRHEAERLLGEALAHTWRSWGRGRTLIAAENHALRRLVASAKAVTPPPPPSRPLPGGLGLDPPERVAARGALRRVLGGLTADERAVLVLRHADGLPVERVALVTGLSVEQVTLHEQAGLGALERAEELAGYTAGVAG